MNRLIFFALLVLPLGLCQDLLWDNISFVPPLSSLPVFFTPEDAVTITVTTPCTSSAAVIKWRFQQEKERVHSIPSSCTSSSQSSCPCGQVVTHSSVTISGNTTSLFNKQVSLTASIEHNSFDPPTFIRSQTTNAIQFPVPVKRVTLASMSFNGETIKVRQGEQLFLSCVTSASFPTSIVTWSGLPLGIKPNTSHEIVFGQLVETTSTVTFTALSEQVNAIQCSASNIDGQLSVQSKTLMVNVTPIPGNRQLQLVTTILGYCIGAVGVIVLVAAITVLYKKRNTRRCDIIDVVNYEDLQHRQPATYEALNVNPYLTAAFQDTRRCDIVDVVNYEELQHRQPATYEALNVNPYLTAAFQGADDYR